MIMVRARFRITVTVGARVKLGLHSDSHGAVQSADGLAPALLSALMPVAGHDERRFSLRGRYFPILRRSAHTLEQVSRGSAAAQKEGAKHLTCSGPPLHA